MELFIVNAKRVGVLRPMAGSERVLTIEYVLDELPSTPATAARNGAPAQGAATGGAVPVPSGHAYEQTCF